MRPDAPISAEFGECFHGVCFGLDRLGQVGEAVALSLFKNVGLLAAIEMVPPVENGYPGQVGKRVGVEPPKERQDQGCLLYTSDAADELRSV